MVKTTKKANKVKKLVHAKVTKKTKKAKKFLLKFNKKVIAGGFLVALLVSALVFMKVLPALASGSVVWSSGVPTTVSVADVGGEGTWRDWCQTKFHSTKQAITLYSGDPNLKTDCFLGSSGGINIYTHSFQKGIAVQFPGDTGAYRTTASCALSCVYLSSTDTLITVESNNNYSTGRVAIYKNFTSRLHLVDSAVQGDRYYDFDASSPVLISNYSGQPGYSGDVRYIQRSSNDRWLVMNVTNAGLVRVDLTTMQMLKFSDWKTDYTYAGPNIEYDVTDDGQHVAVFGLLSANAIYDITSGCGNSLPASPTVSDIVGTQTTACPILDLKAPGGQVNTYMPTLANASQPLFSGDGSQIIFYGVSSDQLDNRLITLQAANYNPAPTPTPTPPSQCPGYSNGNSNIPNQHASSVAKSRVATNLSDGTGNCKLF